MSLWRVFLDRCCLHILLIRRALSGSSELQHALSLQTKVPDCALRCWNQMRQLFGRLCGMAARATQAFAQDDAPAMYGMIIACWAALGRRAVSACWMLAKAGQLAARPWCKCSWAQEWDVRWPDQPGWDGGPSRTSVSAAGALGTVV